jgi:hypothetical protein
MSDLLADSTFDAGLWLDRMQAEPDNRRWSAYWNLTHFQRYEVSRYIDAAIVVTCEDDVR